MAASARCNYRYRDRSRCERETTADTTKCYLHQRAEFDYTIERPMIHEERDNPDGPGGLFMLVMSQFQL